MRKVKCTERRCKWYGLENETLRAPNPFDPEDSLIGCPHCKSTDTIIYACDQQNCWADASCGTPSPTGYRNTCSQHRPKE